MILIAILSLVNVFKDHIPIHFCIFEFVKILWRDFLKLMKQVNDAVELLPAAELLLTPPFIVFA